MNENLLVFNGVNGATGRYDLPPKSASEIAAAARGVPINQQHLTDLRIRVDLDASQGRHYGLREGLDPKDLAQAGWGVIFPAGLDPTSLTALKEAMRPLLDHRKEQAAQQKEHYFKECSGELGYRSGQSKGDFLKIHGRGAGPADPDKLPYYLLIVGDPDTVPFSFQYQLDVQYAVGRIHFDDLEDYHRYALSVVEAEKRGWSLPRRAVFFGTANPDDQATQLSREHLIAPLGEYVRQQHTDWQTQIQTSDQAYKSDLAQLLDADRAPALLFSASHGMGFPMGDARQLPHQGALLCQDWPGPNVHQGPIPQDFYFSAEDLGSDANVLGMLAFFFACYGAGTPHLDDFYRREYVDRKPVAPKAFLAQLPKRMLSHSGGGALAVIGHVERAWGYSFLWDGVGQELVTFESALDRLLAGHPVGSALEYFNSRYAELASDLTTELDETSEEFQNVVKIAGLWTASNDARNTLILGDPAVRLSAGEQVSADGEREALVDLINRSVEQADAVPPEPPASSPQPEPAAPGGVAEPATPVGSPAGVDYGLIDNFRNAQAKMGDALGEFVEKLGGFLGKALDEATSLDIATYVSEEMDDVKFSGGTFSGAKLRALTRIEIDGDTLICVPEEDGELDTELWGIHMDMVRQAQESRAELLKTAVSAASNIVNLIKP